MPSSRRRSRPPVALLALTLVVGALWLAQGRPASLDDVDLSTWPGVPALDDLTAALPAAPSQAPAAAAAPASPDLLTPPPTAEGPFPVVRVVDGDTLIVARPESETRVRVIGIDTPESVAPDQPVECFGPEASQRAEQLLAGTAVRLAGDPTQDRVDRYGRELDYVWLPDGRLFNHVMLAEGYATELTFDAPYAYQADFRAAQSAATAAGAGLWSPTTCGGA